MTARRRIASRVSTRQRTRSRCCLVRSLTTEMRPRTTRISCPTLMFVLRSCRSQPMSSTQRDGRVGQPHDAMDRPRVCVGDNTLFSLYTRCTRPHFNSTRLHSIDRSSWRSDVSSPWMRRHTGALGTPVPSLLGGRVWLISTTTNTTCSTSSTSWFETLSASHMCSVVEARYHRRPAASMCADVSSLVMWVYQGHST